MSNITKHTIKKMYGTTVTNNSSLTIPHEVLIKCVELKQLLKDLELDITITLDATK